MKIFQPIRGQEISLSNPKWILGKFVITRHPYFILADDNSDCKSVQCLYKQFVLE